MKRKPKCEFGLDIIPDMLRISKGRIIRKDHGSLPAYLRAWQEIADVKEGEAIIVITRKTYEFLKQTSEA